MIKKQTRRCFGCDETGESSINISNGSFVTYKKKAYHNNCLVEKLTSGNKKITLSEAEIILNELIIESEIKQQKAKEKDDLVYWIYEHFNISYLGSYFFKRLSEINSGNYKSLKEPVSNEDLLQMYKTKINKMDEFAAYKKKTGSGFETTELRIIYDLAVLVGKYDSYKKWKNKQKIIMKNEEIKNKDNEKYASLDMEKVFSSHGKKNKEENKEEVNIDIDIDELF